VPHHLIRENQLEPFNTGYLIVSYLIGFNTLKTLKMSDTAMDTPESSQTYGHSTLKAQKPDNFYGDRNKLENWILQFDRLFHIEGDKIDDDDKVILVSTYMKGDAEKWVLPILKTYMDDNINDAGNTALVESWDAFKTRLKQVFSPIKESLIAEQKIQHLKQTKSAADYTTLFQQYAVQTQWGDIALMRMYKQGLKHSVRAELMRSGTAINDLEDLTQEAIRVDNELYELALEERSFQTTRGPDTNRQPKDSGRRVQPNHGRQRYQKQHKVPGFYKTYGHEEMHLDNINQGKPTTKTYHQEKTKVWTPKNKESGTETRSCYNCGKPGHLSRNCRSKNKVTRQLNVLTGTQDEEADEWQVISTNISDQVLADTVSEGKRIRHLRELREWHTQLPEIQEGIRNGNLIKDLSAPMGYQKREDFPGLNSKDCEILQKILNDEIAKGTITRDNSRKGGYRLTNGKLDLKYLNEQVEPTNYKESKKREPTPHPGNRVPTVWDYQEEEQDTDDEPLSMEKLAIHTPPDSPTRGHPHKKMGCQTWEEYCMQQQKEKGTRPWISLDGEIHPNLQAYNDYINTLSDKKAHNKLHTTRDLRREREDQQNRQTPKYVNDQQGLIIVDKDYRPTKKSWVDEAEEEYQQQQKTISSAKKNIRYLRDWRNIKHFSISWTACVKDICSLHLQDKEGAQWFPSRDSYCKYQWFDCPRHTCSEHLWDKRTSGSFHPHDESFEAAQKILINGSCVFPLWHQCLQEACEKHQEDKVDHGYLDLGAEEIYSDLDNTESEEFDVEEDETEPFLGQRLAPGLSPGVVMLPTRTNSSNSQ
jgi:hypothetical protein